MGRILAAMAVAWLALAPAAGRAADLVVLSSGGFLSTLQALVPVYEKQTGDHVSFTFGPSMGTTPEAIPARLARGETADVLTMVKPALDQLVQKGVVKADSVTLLANSLIAMAVREGTPKPPIATVAEFKQALLGAKSIAYSDSASGVYIANEMYRKLGLQEQLAPKSHMIPRDPVGEFVARGEYEVGFQQLAELLPVKGLVVVGLIPQEVQLVTPYVAGIPVASKQAEAAGRFIAFLASAEVGPTLTKLGLTPPR